MLPVIGLLIVAYLLAPIIVVVATSFTTTAYPSFPPKGFTLQWFERVLTAPEFAAAAQRSAVLALASASIATVLGTLAGIAMYRHRFRLKGLIGNAMLLPILFPTIVLGLALLIFFSQIGIAGSFGGLVISHSLLTTPFVMRMVMASLGEFDPAIEEAARSLGAGALRTFFLVTLPLIAPGVVAGSVFAFILSFDELVVTLFLAGPDMVTLPVRIFTQVEFSSEPTISAVSTLLIACWLVVGVPVYQRFLSVKHK